MLNTQKQNHHIFQVEILFYKNKLNILVLGAVATSHL